MPPLIEIPNGRRAESFADDLNTRRGIVSGRVALLPRSTEIQPFVAQIRPSPQPSNTSPRNPPNILNPWEKGCRYFSSKDRYARAELYVRAQQMTQAHYMYVLKNDPIYMSYNDLGHMHGQSAC